MRLHDYARQALTYRRNTDRRKLEKSRAEFDNHFWDTPSTRPGKRRIGFSRLELKEFKLSKAKKGGRREFRPFRPSIPKVRRDYVWLLDFQN